MSEADLQRQLDMLFEEMRAMNAKFDSYVPKVAEQGNDIRWIKTGGSAIISLISSLLAVVMTSLLRYLLP